MEYLKFFDIFVEGKKDKPNIRRIQEDDFTILQGRDAESNDHLTFVMSSDDDYWFHAKGVPGSHVVIKVYDKIPDKILIYRAAELAAKNSTAAKKGIEEVEVVYCKKLFVSKKPGMNAGQVAVDSKNSEIIKVKL